MLKKLLFVYIIAILNGAACFAQEGARIALPSGVKFPAVTKTKAQGGSAAETATCATDTITYPFLKEVIFSAPDDSFFVDAMVGSVRTASQGYELTGNINVLGVQFWGNAYSTTAFPQTLLVKAYLYAVNASYQPTAVLDSALVTVNQNYDLYEAMFSLPHPMNTNFAVAVKSMTSDTLGIVTNNAGASWQPVPYNEGLAWRRFGIGTWNPVVNLFGQDLEYMIFPIVDYDITSSFTASDDTVCQGSTVTFINTSSALFSDRMFNLYAFDAYWGFAGADSSFWWNHGDNPSWYSAANGSHTFTVSGTYTTSLAGEIFGYYNSCYDTATMSIVVNPTYSTTASASICYGDTFNFGTQDLTVSGVYTELFSSVDGCDSTVTLTLDVDSIDPGFSFTGPSCNGDCDGVAFSSPTGGTAPYTFQWYNGATTSSVTGLCAGDYSLTVTDASGCTMTGTVTVTEPAVLATSIGTTSVSCFGGSDGSASVVFTNGGTPPYTYQWDPSTGNQTGTTATGLSAGVYSVTVTDANGCTATAANPVFESGDWTGQWDSVFHVTCNGGNDGAIYATVGGATPPYTYSWSHGATTLDITGLTAGGYTLTITDANGCITVEDTFITQPPAIVITIDSTTSSSSCNTANGAAYASASGGTGPLTYMWSPGNGMADDTVGVVSGTYTLTVTDSLGCSVSSTATVSSTSAIAITLDSVFSTSCNGASDGEIYTSATGGNGTLTYMWSPGNGTADDTVGVAAGNYVLTITDANGCTATFTATVTEPAVLTVSVSPTNPSCSAFCDGSATANPAGGTGPFTYLWFPSGGNSQTATGLCAGTYTVCVTDANGCSACTSITLTNPGALTASVTVTNVSCNGGNNGTATVNVSGGSPAFTYSWSTSPVQTTQTATGLTAGTYTVLITDACSQTVTATATITQPVIALQVNTSAFPENPCGANNGQAIALAIGGTSPYTYQWNPTGQTTQNATGLAAGSYTVTVTDAAGCSVVSTVSVTCLPPVGITESTGALSAVLYPNPNSGEFTVEFYAAIADDYTVELSNGLGQVIASDEMKSFSGNYAKRFDIRNYGKGVYLVNIRNSSGAAFRKLIIQ